MPVCCNTLNAACSALFSLLRAGHGPVSRSPSLLPSAPSGSSDRRRVAHCERRRGPPSHGTSTFSRPARQCCTVSGTGRQEGASQSGPPPKPTPLPKLPCLCPVHGHDSPQVRPSASTRSECGLLWICGVWSAESSCFTARTLPTQSRSHTRAQRENPGQLQARPDGHTGALPRSKGHEGTGLEGGRRQRTRGTPGTGSSPRGDQDRWGLEKQQRHANFPADVPWGFAIRNNSFATYVTGLSE